MKKLTIIGLAIIFLLSIVVVGVFGMKNVPYKQIIYTTDLKFTEVIAVHSKMDIPQTSVKKTNSTNYYSSVKVLNYALITEADPLTVMPSYIVYPEDATDKNVEIQVVEGGDFVTVGRNNVVTVKKSVNFKLAYRRTDSAGSPIIYLQIYIVK